MAILSKINEVEMQEIFIDKRKIDKACVANMGVSGEIMMENAGVALAHFIIRILKKKFNVDSKNSNFNNDKNTKIITFLCGGGDNGADSMVASRILDSMMQNIRINVIFLKNIKSDLAKKQSEILRNIASFFKDFSSIKIFDFSDFLDSKKIIDYRIFKLKSLINRSDIIIDSIFGSGFNNTKSTLKNNENYQFLRSILAEINAIKIACDVPSGLANKLGNLELWSEIITLDSKDSNISFNTMEGSENADICDVLCRFDYTLCMGASSLNLYDSRLKDIVGKIKIAPLGFNAFYYNNANFLESKIIESRFFALQKSDLVLPKRITQNSNKGNFGNAYIICGEMSGAASLAAKAAFNFGAGKSIIYTGLLSNNSKNSLIRDYEIIYTENLDILESKDSKNTESNTQKNSKNPHKSHAQNALAIGMGLAFSDEQYSILFDRIHKILDSNPSVPLIFDADMFYRKELIEILKKGQNIVLTPHPKEFASLLKLANIIDSKLNFILENIPTLLLKFSQKFPQITLLLKGANTFIAYNRNLYINNHGDVSLAKGGSGDVLSGLILALLAQGYSAFNATITASLAHAFAAKNAINIESKEKYANYALSPLKIIESISHLK